MTGKGVWIIKQLFALLKHHSLSTVTPYQQSIKCLHILFESMFS